VYKEKFLISTLKNHKIQNIYVVSNATYSRIMYFIIILTIEINNDNNKKRYSLANIIIVLLFPIGSDVQIDMKKSIGSI
jgi:hypothetical protein